MLSSRHPLDRYTATTLRLAFLFCLACVGLRGWFDWQASRVPPPEIWRDRVRQEARPLSQGTSGTRHSGSSASPRYHPARWIDTPDLKKNSSPPASFSLTEEKPGGRELI